MHVGIWYVFRAGGKSSGKRGLGGQGEAFNRMVKVVLIEKVRFNQRLEGGGNSPKQVF